MTASFQENVDAIICLAVHMQGVSPIEYVLNALSVLYALYALYVFSVVNI